MPKDKNGMNPLHFAAGFGNVKAISTLLNLGADANRPDKMGSAPVFYANIFRQTEALQLFGSHEKSCECKN
jgi:ankyrin repeat protein